MSRLGFRGDCLVCPSVLAALTRQDAMFECAAECKPWAAFLKHPRIQPVSAANLAKLDDEERATVHAANTAKATAANALRDCLASFMDGCQLIDERRLAHDHLQAFSMLSCTIEQICWMCVVSV